MMSNHDDVKVVEELRAFAGAKPTASSSWLGEQELRRRSVTRRHHRQATSSAAAVLLVVAIVAVSVVATGRPHPSGPSATSHIGERIGSAVELTSFNGRPTTAPKPGAATPIAQAEVGFGLKVLQNLVASSGGSNELVSPFSLSEALAMAELGARGQTATQLENALGVAALSSSDQAQGWLEIDRLLAAGAAQDRVAFSDANSLWAQTGFPVLPQYLASLQSEFGAGIWQTDFGHHPVAAANSVNEWVSHATGGKIPQLLTPSEVAVDVAVLLNAVYFRAPWATPFASMIHAVFHAPSGDVRTGFVVSTSEQELPALIRPGLDAVQTTGTDRPSRSRQEDTPRCC
jgi:hypothetical protein